MSAMLLLGPAEAGCASSASAPPPSPMLKLSQTSPSSPFSAAAPQPVVLLPAAVLLVRRRALLRRAWPAKLASTAQHSRARWSSPSGEASSNAKYTADGRRETYTRPGICRAQSRRSGRLGGRSRRATLLMCLVSTQSTNTRYDVGYRRASTRLTRGRTSQ
jgi:hypothetical protein